MVKNKTLCSGIKINGKLGVLARVQEHHVSIRQRAARRRRRRHDRWRRCVDVDVAVRRARCDVGAILELNFDLSMRALEIVCYLLVVSFFFFQYIYIYI